MRRKIHAQYILLQLMLVNIAKDRTHLSRRVVSLKRLNYLLNFVINLCTQLFLTTSTFAAYFIFFPMRAKILIDNSFVMMPTRAFLFREGTFHLAPNTIVKIQVIFTL